MRIQFNNLASSYDRHKEEIDSRIRSVASSGSYVLGKEVSVFEEEFAKYVGSKYAIGVGNGMEAIQIALMALGIGKGDEVITTPLSAVASTLAIIAAGATPVFCDIDDFFHLDSTKIETLITPKTRAILPVHLYGQSCDMDALSDISKRRDIPIIEDCAQAHGAKFNEKRLGSIGSAGCFSFYPTKNLGAMGDGGAITTDSAEIAEKCRSIRNYGQKNRYEHARIGVNSRLDEIQAAILSVKLPFLDENNARRKDAAKLYREHLAGIQGVSLPKLRDKADHIYHLFVIETENRDALQKHLADSDIPSLIHYPIPIHKQECLPEYSALNLESVENKSKRILSLPMHPFITEEEIGYIGSRVADFFSN